MRNRGRIVVTLALVLGLVLGLSAPAAAQIWMEPAAAPRQLGGGDDFPGYWEYPYDIFVTGGECLFNWGLTGFDATLCPNLCGGSACQRWDPASAGFDLYGMHGGSYPSRGDQWFTWTIYPGECDLPMLNPWHDPVDYAGGPWSYWYPGSASDTGLSFGYGMTSGQDGLMVTLRVVHPDGPGGTLEFWGDGYGYRYTNEVPGPGGPAIPEPATMSLLALAGLAFRLRSRRAFRLRSRRAFRLRSRRAFRLRSRRPC